MRTVTSENIGEILQRIYDSEINIRLGWRWDAGMDYLVGSTNGVDAPWEPTATDPRTIEAAARAMVSKILEKYPDSTFVKWWRQED